MSSKKYRYSSSSSFSSSSSSQLSTPRALQNGYSQAIAKSPLWDVEEVKCSFSSSVSKWNEELIGEIAELDTEILQLERYLLSLYRSSFGDHLPDNSSLPPCTTKFHNDQASSVSDKSVLSRLKQFSKTDKIKGSDSGHPSLADLLGLNTLSPNKLSEEILRSICVIHYKLSDNGHNRLVKNSKNEEYGQELGVGIHKLYLDDYNLKSVESMLQNFRSLVQKLEKVDPARLGREEKLAFWINIHNALVMHEYIVYGIGEDTTSTLMNLNPQATEEVLIRVPGAILNLIDKSYSVELACGDFTIVRIIQGQNIVAVLANVGNEIQWPLTKNEVAAKVDGSHYFFSIHPPKEKGQGSGSDSDDEQGQKSKSKSDDEILNYGLTIASKGQENVLLVLDQVLRDYSCFTEQRMSEKAKETGEEVLGNSVVADTSPEELKGERKDVVEGQCAAYWTTLAPNVEDYTHSTAKMIASGSGKLIRGILWCGDVTVERLKKGNEVMKNRLSRAEKEKDVSPETLRRIKRVKRVTQMTEKVATGVLSGVVKVSGFITGSMANSKAGKKLFGLLPGEIVLASLDGFSKICDAVEVAGKNVMSTSSTVTTELVNHRYGTKAAEATNEGLDAAGHAFGTAWVAFKIRKAFNPKNVIKPSSLAKSVSELKAKKGSK